MSTSRGQECIDDDWRAEAHDAGAEDARDVAGRAETGRKLPRCASVSRDGAKECRFIGKRTKKSE